MKNTQNTIFDKDGKPMNAKEIIPASRQKIALDTHKFFSSSPEAQEYLTALTMFALQQNVKVNDDCIKISVNDPLVQEFAIGYAANKTIDNALNENLIEAYQTLLNCSPFSAAKYKAEQNGIITDEDIINLKIYFAEIPEFRTAIEVCDSQNEIQSAINGTSNKILTSYQANRLQERLEDIVEYLDYEQRAAAYYNISIVHRMLLSEKDHYQPEDNNSEKECLKKVLENTADYKRIKYCINRLGSSFSNQSTVRAAYRRALTVTDNPTSLFKINCDLAQSYLNDFKPSIGYLRHIMEAEKLQRAELYFAAALPHAQDTEKLGVLKHIAKLQLRQSKIQDWTATETEIAMKYLDGEARVHALMKVALLNKKLQKPYLEQALKETNSAKQISKTKKAMLVEQIDVSLRPIYQKENNQQGLEKLNKVRSKYAPKDIKPINPLNKYRRTER